MASPLDWIAFATFAAVALGTGAVAMLLLGADPRRAWNQWLAFFLLLVAGNFAAQAWGSGLHIAEVDGHIGLADAARGQELAGSLGFVFLVFDPAVLAYFASIFPRRTWLAASPWGRGLLVLPVLAFLPFEVPDRALSVPGPGVDALRIAFFAYLTLAYLYAAWRLLASLLAETSTVMGTQVRVVAAGVVVMALPRVALVLNDLGPAALGLEFGGSLGFVVTEFAVRTGALWLLAGLAWWFVSRQRGPRTESARRMLLTVYAFFAAFTLLWTVGRGVQTLDALGLAVAPEIRQQADFMQSGLTYAIRWFVFAGAILHGVVRYQVLAVDARTLGTAGAAAAALGAFAVVALGASAFGPWVAGAVAAGVVAAAALVLRAGRARPRRTADYLHERGLEVYRAALAAALTEPAARDAARGRQLDRLRDRLGVTAREHDTLVAMAQAEELPSARAVLLGRFEVAKRLGAGGTASVYLARDREAAGMVVLKRIRHDAVGDRAAHEAALRELEVARRVSHANVVAVHDMVRLDDGVVLVMEYCEGGSLRDLLARQPRLPLAEAAPVLAQCLDALEALHEGGIVHGDLKPENILFTAAGQVKLADFGAARAAPLARTLVGRESGPGPGTLLYMAPEQALGQPPSPAGDLYALGAIAYEMVTGSPFVEARGKAPYEVLRAIVEGSAHRRRAGVPRGWVLFLSKALERSPAGRFASAAEMRAALRGLGGDPAAGRRERGTRPAPGPAA